MLHAAMMAKNLCERLTVSYMGYVHNAFRLSINHQIVNSCTPSRWALCRWVQQTLCLHLRQCHGYVQTSMLQCICFWP
jgi:hypothetical protein